MAVFLQRSVFSFTQSRDHSFHLILSPAVMRGSDIVAKVAFILLLACLLLLVSLSPDCSISQVWLTIDSSFLRCECKGSNGAGEAGEGFQRAVGSLVVECPVVGVS